MTSVSASGERTVVFSQLGSVSRSWVTMTARLPSSGVFTIDFTAVPGTSGKGFAGLDEIKFGTCRGEK